MFHALHKRDREVDYIYHNRTIMHLPNKYKYSAIRQRRSLTDSADANLAPNRPFDTSPINSFILCFLDIPCDFDLVDITNSLDAFMKRKANAAFAADTRNDEAGKTAGLTKEREMVSCIEKWDLRFGINFCNVLLPIKELRTLIAEYASVPVKLTFQETGTPRWVRALKGESKNAMALFGKTLHGEYNYYAMQGPNNFGWQIKIYGASWVVGMVPNPKKPDPKLIDFHDNEGLYTVVRCVNHRISGSFASKSPTLPSQCKITVRFDNSNQLFQRGDLNKDNELNTIRIWANDILVGYASPVFGLETMVPYIELTS